MAGDRDIILSRRARFVTAALAAAGLATVVHTKPDEPIAVAEAQPPPQQPPQVCLSIAYNPLDQARDAINRKDFAHALELLKRLYDRSPRPDVLLSLADAQIGLNDFVSARDTYQQLLGLLGNAGVTYPDRAVVDARLKDVEAKLGTVVLAVRGTPDSVTMDDKPIATASLGAPIAANPGVHSVVVAYGGQSARYKIDVSSGATTTLDVDPPPDAGPQVCLQNMMIATPPVDPVARPPSGCGCDVVGRKT